MLGDQLACGSSDRVVRPTRRVARRRSFSYSAFRRLEQKAQRNNPAWARRVTVKDPGILRLLKLLRQDGENAIYVLVMDEGRVVNVYRTLLEELPEID